MRAVIRKAQGQQQQLRPSSQGDVYCASVSGGGSVAYLTQHSGYSRSLSNGTGFSGGEFTNLSSHINSKQNDSNIPGTDSDQVGQMVKPISIEHPADQPMYSVSLPLSHSSETLNPIHSQSLASAAQDLYSVNTERSIANSANPLLGTLLSHNPAAAAAAQLAQYQQQIKQGASNTMLMSMLSDIPAANSPSATFPFLGQATATSGTTKPKKQRKRKATSDSRSPGSSTGRSPKRKLSEDDSMMRDLPTSDVESSDNASTPFDLNTLPSGVADQSLVVRVTPLDPYFKTEVSAQHPSDTVHTSVTEMETNAINDDCSSSVDSYNSVQPKRRYSFNSESEFSVEYNNKMIYTEATESDDIDLDSCDSNAFGMDLNPAMMASKLAATMDRQNKKLKKHKTDNDLKSVKNLLTEEKTEIQDNQLSSDNSPNFPSSSYASTVERSQIEEQLSKTPPLSQSPDLGTSLKIARSGDSLKVSKSEAKIKRKEGRRADDLSKRRGDAKKERKRKRTENADDDSKSPVRTLHLMLDSTLMPPPSTSSSDVTSPLVSTTADSQSLRHTKSLPTVSSTSSPSRSKSPSFSNKKSLLTAHRSSSPISKSLSTGKITQIDKVVKPLPIRQAQVSVGKVSSSEPEGTFGNSKVTLSTSSIKFQTKHKQGSNPKTNTPGGTIGGTNATNISVGCGQTQSSSNYTPGGNSSPSKSLTKPHTLKLKSINLPSSTTITPVPIKTHTTSPSFLSQAPVGTQAVPTSIAITPTSVQSGKSPSSNNNAKGGKSISRSRKGGLNAVIDKLMVTASAQHINTSPSDGSKLEGPSNKVEYSSERKESKLEKKDISKESLKEREGGITKGSEPKPKYSSSDQFTVKQSSQGIKLTVTKTRFTDNSKSLGKLKQPSKQSASNITSSTKITSSSGNTSTVKTGNSFTQKKSVVSSSTCISPKSTSVQSKNTSSLVQKNQTPITTSATVPTSSSSKVLTSSNSISKPTSKVTLSSQNKSSLLNSKVSSEKLDKLKPATTFETKTSPSLENRSDKISNNFITVGANLMPPPLHPNKSISELNRSVGSGSSIMNRHEESSLRQSPRHTPTRETTREESEGERAFRLLLAQTSGDSSQNGTVTAEQRVLTPKSDLCTGGSIENSTANSKHEAIPRNEIEEKPQWVTSSTDIKPSSTVKCPSEKRSEEVTSETPLVIESLDRKVLNTQIEVTSSSKPELSISTTSLTSAEESSRSSVSPFPPKSRRGFPSSEDSSPEDSLIIDCPSTPRLQKSPEKKVSWSSPRIETALVNDEKVDSPSVQFNAKSPFQPSPSIKSPIPVTTPPSNHSASSSMSRQSPYVIDDDLMDEALIGVGK